jgi:hypothetical protein
MIALDSPYEQARIRVALADAAARLGDTDGTRRHLELALAVYDALRAPEAQQVRLALTGQEDGLTAPGPGSPPGTGQ